MKKQKWINIALWGGLALLILVVIITAMILHSKRQKLDDLKDKNDIVKPEEGANLQENKIFFKNFEIFIDKPLDF